MTLVEKQPAAQVVSGWGDPIRSSHSRPLRPRIARGDSGRCEDRRDGLAWRPAWSSLVVPANIVVEGVGETHGKN